MWRDEAYLLDILIAARQILKFNALVTRDEFERDLQLQLATMKLLENIGEAARNISLELREAHPEIPWTSMIGMRNRLVHEYFRVNLARAWETVQDDVPRLIQLIEPLVPPEDE